MRRKFRALFVFAFSAERRSCLARNFSTAAASSGKGGELFGAHIGPVVCPSECRAINVKLPVDGRTGGH